MVRLFGITLMLLITSCSNEQSLDAKIFQQRLNESIQLVDVRTSEEFATGHLANALLMDVNKNDFEHNIVKLDKTKPVYVYCRSGKRSHIAAGIMKKHGFKQVNELKGGIISWQQTGLPVIQ